MRKNYLRKKYGYDWIIGNEKVFAANARFVEQDLNRSAPGDINSHVYEVRRAAELIEYGKNFDVVIDLHGTKTDSGIVTIIPYSTEENIRLAKSAGLSRNVVWYSEKSKIAGPLAQHMSVPAIEFECGLKGTKKAFDLTYAAVRRFIEANRSGQEVCGDKNVEFYNVYGKLYGEHDPTLRDFVLAEKGGESFYPFLSNEYSGIVCYKMEKTKNDKMFI